MELTFNTSIADPLPATNFDNEAVGIGGHIIKEFAKKGAMGCGKGPERDRPFQHFMGDVTGQSDANQRIEGGYQDGSLAHPYPAMGTQQSRLLAALLSGKKIDPLTGWFMLGIYRLSDTVLRLRKRGWPIITDILDVKNRFGEQCEVANYYLLDDAIDAAGDRGKEFCRAAVARKEVS